MTSTNAIDKIFKTRVERQEYRDIEKKENPKQIFNKNHTKKGPLFFFCIYHTIAKPHKIFYVVIIYDDKRKKYFMIHFILMNIIQNGLICHIFHGPW